MKVVILAGGRGTRICEETVSKPKPMVTIGDMPILWHLMKIYSHYGLHDFIICLGHKGEIIKRFFEEYELRMSDVTFDMREGKMKIHRRNQEPWCVTLIDTGLDTGTGGRLKRVREYVKSEPFFFTYGDGLSDVNIDQLLRYHRKQGKLVTMTVSRHTSRFGVLKLTGDNVDEFVEKPVVDGSWMNSGFFVMQPEFLNFIEGDHTILEKNPIKKLVQQKQLAAFRHSGFFRGMDSMRDKNELEALWEAKLAPWKKWVDGSHHTAESQAVQNGPNNGHDNHNGHHHNGHHRQTRRLRAAKKISRMVSTR